MPHDMLHAQATSTQYDMLRAPVGDTRHDLLSPLTCVHMHPNYRSSDARNAPKRKLPHSTCSGSKSFHFTISALSIGAPSPLSLLILASQLVCTPAQWGVLCSVDRTPTHHAACLAEPRRAFDSSCVPSSVSKSATLAATATTATSRFGNGNQIQRCRPLGL
jgi:hypothetical protein